MSLNRPKFGALLIDDDPFMEKAVRLSLKMMTSDHFDLSYALRCSGAMDALNSRPFDIILLDNRLSQQISAEFSVPMLKAAAYSGPIAIISSDLSPAYLANIETLGVDHIVDKLDIVPFLQTQIGLWARDG